jgi:membrane protein DedA with SNARE-associated domain
MARRLPRCLADAIILARLPCPAPGGDKSTKENNLAPIEEQIVLFLQNLLTTVGWPGVVFAMTVESALIPLPSEVTMLLAGWMLISAQKLSMIYVLWAGLAGAIGNTLGSVIIYWLGAYGGRPLLERYGKYVFISREHIELADRWFQRYGEATAFFSRLMPVVRTFISLPLGIARMNFTKFTILTFLGSFLWSTMLAGAGFIFGENWREIREAMRPFDIPIILALIVLVIWYFGRHLKRSRKQNLADEVAE